MCWPISCETVAIKTTDKAVKFKQLTTVKISIQIPRAKNDQGRIGLDKCGFTLFPSAEFRLHTNRKGAQEPRAELSAGRGGLGS